MSKVILHLLFDHARAHRPTSVAACWRGSVAELAEVLGCAETTALRVGLWDGPGADPAAQRLWAWDVAQAYGLAAWRARRLARQLVREEEVP